MKLKVFGSSSKGNGYALTDSEGLTLLIEFGVPLREVQKHFDFDLTGIVGGLLSHAHGDHCNFMPQFLVSGIDVYTGPETAERLGYSSHHRVTSLMPEVKIYIGPFIVMPFSLKHDIPCFGFLINHAEMGNTVFITDSFYSPFKFKNVSNWIVECNYSKEILDSRAVRGATHQAIRNRIVSSHFSLEHCIEMFEANDMSKTNNIVLVHLSDTNSHAVNFQAEVTASTLKNVHIAEPGLELELNKTPF